MEYENDGADGLLVTRFRLGDATFGLDARLVQEVVKVGETTYVHDAPDYVAGIRNLRGRIVTVVDMATHLGLGAVEPGPESRLLIAERNGESFGFLVDAVADAVALEIEDIESPPVGIAPMLRDRLRGVWREGEHLTAVLDPEALFVWHDD